MDLNEAEVLVALVLENLREQGDIVLLPNVRLDSVDDRGGPLHDKRLKTVLLVEVGVHILL